MVQVLASVSISRRSVPGRGSSDRLADFRRREAVEHQPPGPAELETRADRWLLLILGSCGKLVRNHGARPHGAMVGGAKTHCSVRRGQTVASVVLAITFGSNDLWWRGSFIADESWIRP